MPPKDLDRWLFQVSVSQIRQPEGAGFPSPFARCAAWQPPVDVLEDSEAVSVLVELAAVEPEAVRVSYEAEAQRLTIRGRRDTPHGGSARPVQLEIYSGEFERVIGLPEAEYDLAGATAEYHAGLLTVRLPKGSSAPSSARIQLFPKPE